VRNYSTQIKNELKDKIDLVSERKEGAPDYFAYIRGSGITEDTQESGYRGAVAAALRASNEYDTTFQTDADLCIRTIEDVYTAAQEADANCCAKLRAVIESLQEWKLLARKLNLSITGGGGYQEQLFTANNIRCWVGNVPQTVAQVSVDCWKDIFTDIDPTTGEATYNQAALTDYFALSEEVYTQDSLNSVFAIMTAGLVEATDLVCLTSDRNFNAEQFNLLMQCGTTQIFSADNPLQMCGLPTSVKQLDAEYYYVSYNVSPVLQLFSNTYNAMIDCKLQYGENISLLPENRISYYYDISQQESFASILKYTTTGNCISIGIPFTDEEIETAKNAISAGDAPQYILDNISTDSCGNVDPFTSVGTYVQADFSLQFAETHAEETDTFPRGVRIESPIIASQVDWNEYLLPSVNILEGEHEYLDYYYLSATVEDNVLKDLEINQTTSRIENVHDAIINSLSDSVSTTVSNYVISKLPFADEINIGIKMTKIAQKAISASMDVVENNTSINIELRQEAAGISVASTGAYVSMIADDTGSVEFQRAYFSPGLLQEKLAYFAYSMNDQTIHTYDEYIIESGSECLIADDLTENYSPDKWINTFVRNGGTEPLDASFNTFCRYLETAWNRYCVDSGNSQYANINIQRLSPVDIIELTMSLEKYGYQEINIDLSKYTQYLEDYN